MTAVSVILPADRHRAKSTLMLAFANDPIVRWLLPDTNVYAEYWPRIIDAFAGNAFGHGTAHEVDGFAGVALWFPPGVGSDDAAFAALLEVVATDSNRLDLDGFFGQMGDLHPTFDHWYLPLAGVDPPAQGRGLGSSLLEHALETCDRQGLPAYLEATAPRNRDMYARHGFDEIGVIQEGGSPPLWRMLRQPR